MSKTMSLMMPLGTLAIDFSLKDTVSGTTITLPVGNDVKAIVIMFICNHCPYVKHIDNELSNLARHYSKKSICFIAINSNDIDSYPDDSPENMKKVAISHNYPFPYLFDETQDVARAYMAACTPDFFIFDAKRLLVYRGQFDNSRPSNNIAVSGESISHALDCILTKKPILMPQIPSLGCNIKWRRD
jgi:thiol-disulfide isomerase/thioredoxin